MGANITETIYYFDFFDRKLEIAVIHKKSGRDVSLSIDDKKVLETFHDNSVELSDPELIKKTGEDFAKQHANNKYSDIFMNHGDKLVLTKKLIRFADVTDYSTVLSKVIITKGFTEMTSETGIEGEHMSIRLAGDNFSDVFEKIRLMSMVMQNVMNIKSVFTIGFGRKHLIKRIGRQINYSFL